MPIIFFGMPRLSDVCHTGKAFFNSIASLPATITSLIVSLNSIAAWCTTIPCQNHIHIYVNIIVAFTQWPV